MNFNYIGRFLTVKSLTCFTAALTCSNKVNNIGIYTRVRKVETIKPPMVTTASGDKRSKPTAHCRAIGTMPAAVPRAVITIGRVLARTLFKIASSSGSPRRCASRIKSISKIEFFTTIPALPGYQRRCFLHRQRPQRLKRHYAFRSDDIEVFQLAKIIAPVGRILHPKHQAVFPFDPVGRA